jgi:hypothetical protein
VGESQNAIDPKRLVFIDETWTKTNMEPLRGWAPRGERLVAKVPHEGSSNQRDTQINDRVTQESVSVGLGCQRGIAAISLVSSPGRVPRSDTS